MVARDSFVTNGTCCCCCFLLVWCVVHAALLYTAVVIYMYAGFLYRASQPLYVYSRAKALCARSRNVALPNCIMTATQPSVQGRPISRSHAKCFHCPAVYTSPSNVTDDMLLLYFFISLFFFFWFLVSRVFDSLFLAFYIFFGCCLVSFVFSYLVTRVDVLGHLFRLHFAGDLIDGAYSLQGSNNSGAVKELDSATVWQPMSSKRCTHTHIHTYTQNTRRRDLYNQKLSVFFFNSLSNKFLSEPD